MNVCPVYERTGGHAYGFTYPGPIGAILSPLMTGIQAEANNSLPYASSLCGACYDVCPVRIERATAGWSRRKRAIAGTKKPSAIDSTAPT